MALTGELDDLSLAELIEFFCNQRKTGRLKVVYPVGAGYFYLKSGSVVHARFGDLRGIEAVYYALTQPNASFTFSPAFEAPELTINQPWTSVVLEGLRRMDEGLHPPKPSTNGHEDHHEEAAPEVDAAAIPVDAIVTTEESEEAANSSSDDVKAFGVLLSQSENNSFTQKRWSGLMIAGAVVVLIAAIGVPWGWYTHKKAVRFENEAKAATPNLPALSPTPTPETVSSTPAEETQPSASSDTAELAKRQREARAKERAKALEQGAVSAANNGAPASPRPTPTTTQSSPAAASKRVTVQVTYDENGRVTQASGGDATALRIARQKRFPAGKPGSATVTIPIN